MIFIEIGSWAKEYLNPVSLCNHKFIFGVFTGNCFINHAEIEIKILPGMKTFKDRVVFCRWHPGRT